MKINFYYNISCPRGFISYQNLQTAIKNLGIQCHINFVPTQLRGLDKDEVRSLLKKHNMDSGFVLKKVNTEFVDKIMKYTVHQQMWYELVTQHYFYENMNIENKKEVIELLQQIDSICVEEIESTRVQYADYDATTIEIDSIIIHGIKSVAYYEFALSCFLSQKREVELNFGECICKGKYCE